jgi:hypothetical protein
MALVIVSSCYGLLITNQLASEQAAANAIRGIHFDSSQWSLHWAVYGLSLLSLGVAGMASAVALFLKRHGGFLALGIVFAVASVRDYGLVAIGYSKYTFEAPGAVEAVLLALLSLICFSAFFSRRLESNKR